MTAQGKQINRRISSVYYATDLGFSFTIRLVIGSLCGAVIMFESALRRTILQDKFELTFVAPSQVLVKELQETAGENVLIESQLGLEIYDVRIMGSFSMAFPVHSYSFKCVRKPLSLQEKTITW